MIRINCDGHYCIYLHRHNSVKLLKNLHLSYGNEEMFGKKRKRSWKSKVGIWSLLTWWVCGGVQQWLCEAAPPEPESNSALGISPAHPASPTWWPFFHFIASRADLKYRHSLISISICQYHHHHTCNIVKSQWPMLPHAQVINAIAFTGTLTSKLLTNLWLMYQEMLAGGMVAATVQFNSTSSPRRYRAWAPDIVGGYLIERDLYFVIITNPTWWGTTTTRRSPNFESVAKLGASSLTWTPALPNATVYSSKKCNKIFIMIGYVDARHTSQRKRPVVVVETDERQTEEMLEWVASTLTPFIRWTEIGDLLPDRSNCQQGNVLLGLKLLIECFYWYEQMRDDASWLFYKRYNQIISR